MRDPHDVCWHDGALHVVSSWDAAVWRLGAGGATVAWRGGEVPDSWHPNCLVVHEGRLHLSAFGRGDRHKQFGGEEAPAAGFILDLDRGLDVASGLSQPHDPRPHRGGWLVCESTLGTLTELDRQGAVTRRLEVGRYTRGLAVVGRWAFLGGNARRGEEGPDRAEVWIVDLDRFEAVDRVQLPCLEVYDIVAVPAPLVAGLRVGFATNAFRTGEQRARSTLDRGQRPTPDDATVRLVTAAQEEAVARSREPVPLGELAGAVQAELPRRVAAGASTTVRATVANASALAWSTLPPHPLGVTPRWYRAGDEDVAPVVGRTSPLAAPLAPGSSAEVEVLLEAPGEPGRYLLGLTLRQRGVGWFGRRCEGWVEVVPPT